MKPRLVRGFLHIRRVPTPAGVIGQNGGLAGQCKGSRSPTTVFLAATTHANSTNANIDPNSNPVLRLIAIGRGHQSHYGRAAGASEVAGHG
mgnify:CR=1 FL=1